MGWDSGRILLPGTELARIENCTFQTEFRAFTVTNPPCRSLRAACPDHFRDATNHQQGDKELLAVTIGTAAMPSGLAGRLCFFSQVS